MIQRFPAWILKPMNDQEKKLRDLLDTVAADAEAARDKDQGAPLPPHVKVGRPNRARGDVEAGPTGTMGKRLEQALAEADEIKAAEADQTDRPLPPHVKVTRPGRARTTGSIE